MRRSSLLIVVLACLCGCGAGPFGSSIAPQNPADDFALIDTSKAGSSIGCGGSLFKLLNDSCVLVIHLPSHLPDGVHLQVDSIHSPASADLYLFSKDSASLMNICTDLIISNAPRPIATLQAFSGELVFRRESPIPLYGSLAPVSSIIVKYLSFADSTSTFELHVKDELLWRVVDLGTPG